VRPDLASSRKLVSVDIVSHKDLIDLNTRTAVTKVYLRVRVNGTDVDFYAQNDFDAQRLIDALNYQNEKNTSLRVLHNKDDLLYSKNYFFTLVSETRVKRSHYTRVEKFVRETYYKYHEGEGNVTVTATWQEEYVDSARKLWFGLSVLISANNRPVDDLDKDSIGRDLELLSIDADLNSDDRRDEDKLVYRFRLPTSDEFLQPLAKAVTFFSNYLVCRRDFERVETFIRNVIENYKPGNYLSFSTSLKISKTQIK
jgi:hypothetical protein